MNISCAQEICTSRDAQRGTCTIGPHQLGEHPGAGLEGVVRVRGVVGLALAVRHHLLLRRDRRAQGGHTGRWLLAITGGKRNGITRCLSQYGGRNASEKAVSSATKAVETRKGKGRCL